MLHDGNFDKDVRAKMKDVFLCHASEDKEIVVRPLAETLEKENISYWLDEAEIKWGDSITQKVSEGLSISKYVIVIISQAFISKNWPQKELYSALNLEITSGNVKVLPLLHGNPIEKQTILNKIPLLNDKLYFEWKDNAEEIVHALSSRLGNKLTMPENHTISTTRPLRGKSPSFPLPEIRKRFTQQDKDIFLKNSFDTIKRYFKDALMAFEKQYPEVTTDITEVNNLKFISKIYIEGEIANQCKIWIGGISSSDSILYSSDSFIIDNDNSYNEMLFITDNETSIGLKPTMSSSFLHQNNDAQLSDIEAAEHLWKLYTERLSS